MGIYVATAASGFSFGLILGGLLTTFLSWHWVFYVNVPFALLILLLGPVMIKESHSQLGSRSYDLAGAVTVTAGVLLLVYAITQSTQSTPRLVNRLGMRLSAVLGLLCLALGIALFTRIGPSSDYLGIILLPSLVTIALGMSIGYPALSIAAVSGIANEEQGLVAGLQATALQVGGGLWLAITTAVVVGSSVQTQAVGSQASTAAVQAQLTGFHLGLLVVALVAAAGALIVLVGIQHPPAAAPQASAAAPQALEEEAVPRP